jgi:hypothetical protein
MAKEPKQRYVLNLKLHTESFQEDILEKRFEMGRHLYNSILNVSLKRYNEMIKTKRWRGNQVQIANIYKLEKDEKKRKKIGKEYFDIRNEMLKEFRINEYSFHDDISNMQHHFKKNMDSLTAQKIASQVWKAYDKLLYGNGEQLHFKSYNDGLNSLEGKWNKSGIVYKIESNTLEWNKLKINVQSNFNYYEISALRDKICFCRIVRKFVRGKYKYTLQLVLNGIPPIKINKNTGEIKNDIGIGSIGIDIGTQTIAYSSDHNCKLYELAPRVRNIENEERRLLRYMDRSKRIMNPNNFNKNGTIKRGIKLEWSYSNEYIKAKNMLKELYRKQADIRKQDHNIMANEIIGQTDMVLVEKMNFKGLQKRAKNTTTNEKTGKFNKKKRFGKSLANKAPAMLMTIIKNKLKAKGGIFLEVNTFKVKASQYNHLNGEYNKKKLNQRWNYFNYNNEDIKIQRDLYSSYLIKNVNSDLETINNDKCIEGFEKFLEFHNIEIDRLQRLNNLSSMGI